MAPTFHPLLTGLILVSACRQAPRAFPEARVEGLSWDIQRLKQYGDLKPKANFPHGLAPMVAVLTEAFPGVPDAERAYRKRLTAQLDSALSREVVSLWILRPPVPSSTLSEELIWRHINEGFDFLLGIPGDDGPQAFIGFAETAPEAAELALQYVNAGQFILLVPSSARSLENWHVAWRRLLSRNKHLSILVLESLCNVTRATPDMATKEVTVLPGYDRWLVKRQGGGCDGTPPHPSLSADVIETIVDWLKQHLHYRT